MNRDDIGSGLGKGFKIRVGRCDHQMDIESLSGARAYGLDDVRTKGDVWNKVSIHHIAMNPVGTGFVDSIDLVAQAGKIGR